jgi:hypothetical protein
MAEYNIQVCDNCSKGKICKAKEVVIKPIYWTVSESAEESGDSTEET